MIEKGDAQVVDGTVVLRGSLEPGQQRPPIPRPASGQDSRRHTMQLDQLSQKSGGQQSQQNLLGQQPPEDEQEGDY